MIGRRGVLTCVALVAAHPAGALSSAGSSEALPVPPGDALSFRLIRHDAEIGRHALVFEPRGDTLTVRVNVEARVTVLGIPIVHYTHRVEETWQDGVLAGMHGETDKNGRTEWVRARRTPDGLLVQGSRTKDYIAPESAIGTSYWNMHMLDGPMISMEDGVLLHPKVTRLGIGPIPLADGATVPASRYNLSGSFNVDVWYDRANTWASLAFSVADGSEVHYERL